MKLTRGIRIKRDQGMFIIWTRSRDHKHRWDIEYEDFRDKPRLHTVEHALYLVRKEIE